MWKDFQGNLMLWKFYIKSVSTLHKLPKWMRNPDALVETITSTFDVKNPKDFELSVPSDVSKEYNDDFEVMKSQMRSLYVGEGKKMSYKTTLMLLFTIRLVCILTAYEGNLPATLLIGSLQFLIAPYSLFVSLTLAAALAPPIYFCHYIVFSLMASTAMIISEILPSFVTDSLVTVTPYLSLSIGPTFILAFFIIDQAICLYCHLMTPCKKFSIKETMIHIIWGFMNTKTYTLVVLLHMMNAGVSIPLLLWIIDWKLKLTLTVSNVLSSRFMHWLELFYTQHRIAHLPRVYEHAHKLHHYLHGTLAFDAHIYGNGMPEEYFFLLLELAMGVSFGIIPASLNRSGLISIIIH